MLAVTCEGWCRIDGIEIDRAIGIVSILSSTPLSLAARLSTEGIHSNEELPTAFPTGVYGCALCCPLTAASGDSGGISDPSGMGTSVGSWLNTLNLGISGIRDLPLSCLSSSAMLVLLRILLLILELTSPPSCISGYGTGMYMSCYQVFLNGNCIIWPLESTMPLGRGLTRRQMSAALYGMTLIISIEAISDSSLIGYVDNNCMLMITATSQMILS